MMRHLLVCLPLPTAAQTKSEHFTFAERQALRFGTDAMSRTTLILVTFVLATGCGDSGNPVGPSPTSIPNVAGTYSGSVTATITSPLDSETGSMRMSVVQVGSQLTITGEITFPGETFQLPALTGTINATGFFTATGGGVTSASSDECGTANATSSTLTFSGNTARLVETLTTQYCGNLSVSATLSR